MISALAVNFFMAISFRTRCGQVAARVPGVLAVSGQIADWHDDRVHRIGLLVPSSNTTMETEVPAMLRARERVRREVTFTFHSARLRMEDVTPEALRAMNEQTERAITELADLRPDGVATACLVAIMAQGPGSHCAAEAEIAAILEREHAHGPVVSCAGGPPRRAHRRGRRGARRGG